MPIDSGRPTLNINKINGLDLVFIVPEYSDKDNAWTDSEEMKMVKALLPSGRQIYAEEKSRISVCLDNKRSAERIQRAIREHLKNDPRYLCIDIQPEPNLSCWQACIRWGDAKEYQECPPLILPPNEQNPEAIIAKISRELSRFHFGVTANHM